MFGLSLNWESSNGIQPFELDKSVAFVVQQLTSCLGIKIDDMFMWNE